MTTNTLPDCVEAGTCYSSRKHGACADCGRTTHQRELRIDPATLRRRNPYVCSEDVTYAPGNEGKAEDQAVLRERRTKRDWLLVTDPIEADRLEGAVMPEQYASKARAAVRAFFDAGFEVATVTDSNIATLAQSIVTLGLDGQVYAEQRNNETVLRRIGA